MSQYQCLECDQNTSVIDTRPSNGRLRRRRKCPHGHRFSTMEVATTAKEQIQDLILWAANQQQADEDVTAYIEAKVNHILFGLPDPDEPDEPDNPNTEP